MDATIVGAALFAALLVTFGVLRKRITDLERTVSRLQDRVETLTAQRGEQPAPAAPAVSEPIDVEPFVD